MKSQEMYSINLKKRSNDAMRSGTRDELNPNILIQLSMRPNYECS